MTGSGLGCVKTPTVAASVETSRRNCVPESQIILHTRGVMPSWRIVFSTFRDCMSFHTARVNHVRPTRPTSSRDVRFSSNCVPTLAPQQIDAECHFRTNCIAANRVLADVGFLHGGAQALLCGITRAAIPAETLWQ